MGHALVSVLEVKAHGAHRPKTKRQNGREELDDEYEISVGRERERETKVDIKSRGSHIGREVRKTERVMCNIKD